MLSAFSVLGNKKIDDAVVRTYQEILLKYSDEDIHKATKKCLEECTSYPKPKDVVDRIPFRDRTKRQYRFEWGMCSKCGEMKHCIRDPIDAAGECRECYTGLSDGEINFRFGEVLNKIQNVEIASGQKRKEFEPQHAFDLSPDEILRRKQKHVKNIVTLYQYYFFYIQKIIYL